MDENKTSSNLEIDFQRNIHSILGLPFDALEMKEAVMRVCYAIDMQNRCFISTPNVNFLIGTQTDYAFRQSVINSDLCLVDGMPLIWIARLLKIPIKERLAGSGLVESLMCSEHRVAKPVKVFFFGGMDGVAKLACEMLNKKKYGISCVGSLNPGFGSVESMSKPEIIEQINQSGAEFVIASLGAKKGQEWIDRNRHHLKAPVISHLGAVVNFVSGTIDRAPKAWQRSGLEWLWRIKEEPALCSRYFRDGLILFKLLLTRVLPYAFLIRLNKGLISSAPTFSIAISKSEGKKIVSIKGTVTSGQLQVLRHLFVTLVPGVERICIKLEETAYIDPSFCGLVLVLYKHVGDRLSLVPGSKLIRNVLIFNGLDFLLK